MLKLFKPLLDIAFFRSGPDTLPRSNVFLFLLLLAQTVISFFAVTIAKFSFVNFLPSILLTILAYAALTYALLSAVGKEERFQQTFSALIGVDVVITLCILPSLFLITNFPEGSLSYTLGQWSYLLTLVWSVGAIAVILNKAVEWNVVFGYVLAPGFFFSLLIISQVLFPLTRL